MPDGSLRRHEFDNDCEVDVERELFERLDDGAVRTPTVLGPGFDGVLAVDVWRRWGAVYWLTVTGDGEWISNIDLAQRKPDGSWDAMSGGGARGDGWDAGWSPEIHSPSLLRVGELVGQDVEDEDGSDIELVARTGYAAAGVTAVRVKFPDDERVVQVFPLLNAFVILGPEGPWALTALGANDEELGIPVAVDSR